MGAPGTTLSCSRPTSRPTSNSGIISYRGISGLYNSKSGGWRVEPKQALFAEARGRASGSPYVFSPQDSIKEFQSSTSPGYSAEFGNAAGGQINAITKSGSNAISTATSFTISAILC